MAMINKYDVLTFSITRACKLAYYSRFMTLRDQMRAGGIKGRFLLKSVVEKCYLWHCTTYIMDLRWDSVVRSYVFMWLFGFTVWFQRKRCEALLAIIILRHDSCSMVKSASGKCHRSRDLRTGNGGSSLCGEVELVWWFVTWSSGIKSGGDSIGEVKSYTLQGENPMSGLNWLCLAITLLKALFLWARIFSRVKI
jgi:hypothetical protein